MNQNSGKCMRCREAGMKKRHKKFVFGRILALTFRAAPVEVSVILLTGILHSVFLVLQTVCMQVFFERVSAGNLQVLAAGQRRRLAGDGFRLETGGFWRVSLSWRE